MPSVDITQEEEKTFGLEINWGKTKKNLNDQPQNPPEQQKEPGDKIPESFAYLGSVLQGSAFLIKQKLANQRRDRSTQREDRTEPSFKWWSKPLRSSSSVRIYWSRNCIDSNTDPNTTILH
ncbi:hypothetical protein CHS0354_033998 [Potamilus streckersoni]|uniref:Uncharacterized protein n=1 Tax=Potamilus streckersoni TaxID=2493646 RepID=A0AAE0RMK9_9BIVA|nr:hypothetical protein CHS0354_033998 [Potamilus streckersoni]